MKIYEPPKPKNVIRLQITRQGVATEYLNLEDCTMDGVSDMVMMLIRKHAPADPFMMGKKTSVNIRDCVGGKNGKSKSISFRGLNPAETKAIIEKHVIGMQ